MTPDNHSRKVSISNLYAGLYLPDNASGIGFSYIASLFGGKTRASKVMNGKRALNLKMITLLNRYLGIPLESLVSENNEIKLETEKKEELLNIPSIKEYLNNRRAAMA